MTTTRETRVDAILLVTVALFISAGVAQVCNTLVGIQDPAVITSDLIVVSSAATGFDKEKLRYDCCKGTVGSAWCPSPSDSAPFVEIHLPKPVVVGKLLIQPPTALLNPSNFLKTFKLSMKLEGINNPIAVSEDVTALSNDSIILATISLHPPLMTDLIRIEPLTFQNSPCFRLELMSCDLNSLCPAQYCQNGGQCSGQSTCDCTSTAGFYGDRCQYQKQQIPVVIITFLKIVQQTIVTSTKQIFTFNGQVTLTKFGSTNVLTINPGSFVTVEDPNLQQCLHNLDGCVSGFSISVAFSFERLDQYPKFVLTSGGEDQNLSGIALFFQQGTLYCIVGTSTQVWTVTTKFQVIENTWYEMIVSWSPGQGLIVVQGGLVIASAFIPGTRRVSVTKTQELIIGHHKRYTNTFIKVSQLTSVSLFWREAHRAGVLTDSVPTSTPNLRSWPATTAPATTTKTTVAILTPPSPTTPSSAIVCTSKLGMESGAISASQITASSSTAGHGTEKMRAGCCQGEEDGGWCAASSDSKPWVQVTLPSAKAVSSLNFQLPERVGPTVTPANYVKAVRMEYRDVSTTAGGFQLYSDRVPVTYNSTIAYAIALNPAVITDTVRMYITEAQGLACFRFELLGCDVVDLCPPNYCENNGTCAGQNKCSCDDQHYGEKCQYTKTQITPTLINFKKMINNTITTTVSTINLLTRGNVSLTKVGTTTAIKLTNGGFVTFPQDPCLAHLDKCLSGFTLTLVVNLVSITDDHIQIVTSGGDKPSTQGLVLVYNRITHTLTYTITTSHVKWTLVSPFTFLENHWYRVTLTWSPSTGIKLVIDGVLVNYHVGGSQTPSATGTHPLCIGCTYVTKTITSTILIKTVVKVNVFIDDLKRASLVDVKTPQDACKAAKSDFTFRNVSTTKTEIVTSLGTMEAHGDVSLSQEGADVILVLDHQGEYVKVTNTGLPCVDDITTCKTDLTYRMTFRFLDFHVEPNFLLSSGGDLLNSTGMSLYYYQGNLNLWVKDGVKVWMAIYKHTMTLNRWYTLDASWSHTGGIKLRLDGQLLTSAVSSVHPAAIVNEKHKLHIARSPGATKDKTTLMEILMLRVWTETPEKLQQFKCDQDLKIVKPVDKCSENLSELRFKSIGKGNDLLTSLGTMTTHGNVTLEMTLYQQGQMVLVIDEDGEYVDMGHTGVTCLDDVTQCTSSFNFRIVFMLTEISLLPSYILSSGGELNNATGVSLYYYNKKVYFWVKQGVRIDRSIIDTEFKVNTWYTLDASWNSTSGDMHVYVDGTEASGFHLPSTPTPTTQDKYPILLAKSPGKDNSTKMNILLFQFWERTREELISQGCDRVLNVHNPPNPPPTTTSAPTVTPTRVTFTKIVGNKLVTTHTAMTIHGTVTLQPRPTGNVLVIETTGSYVDVGPTGIPCLDDISSCLTGFNFRMTFTLTSITTNSQVLVSTGTDKDPWTGLTVNYISKTITIYIKRSKETLIGTFPCVLTPGFWYTIDISWSVKTGLELHVNNILTTGQVNKTTHTEVTLTHSLLIGKSPSSNSTTSIRVIEINIWNRIYTHITTQQLVIPKLTNIPITTTSAPNTTTPIPKLSTQVPTSTAPTRTKPTPNLTVPTFEWTLTQITKTTTVSHGQELTLIGGPKSGPDGVILVNTDHSIKIPTTNNPCLTDPDRCVRGLTVGITIKLLQLVENTVIFTSGGEKPDQPGVTFLYRYGFIHVIVSTTSQSWYVSVSRQVIRTNRFCNIHVSWSKTTTLKLFINQVLVGVSENPLPHKPPTLPTTTTLVIGGGNTRCVVKEVHIWLVHIEILIQIGIVNIPGGTTPATALPTPGTTAATTTASTTPMATPPVTDALTTSKAPPTPTTADTCPVGCLPKDACTTISIPSITTTPRPKTPPTPSSPPTAPPAQTSTTPKAPQTTPTTTTVKVTTPTTPTPTTSSAPTTQPPVTPRTPSTTTPVPTPTTTTSTTEAPTTTTQKTSTPAVQTPTPPSTPPQKPPTTTTTTEPTTTAATTSTTTSTTQPPSITTTPETTKTTSTTQPPPPTTTTTTPATTTTTTTTTQPPPPTTTTTTTATTTTTTTTTPPTTTAPRCPDPPGIVTITVSTDVNGMGYFICTASRGPSANEEMLFTWHVVGEAQTWSRKVKSPDLAAPLPVTVPGMNLLNKQIFCKASVKQTVPTATWCHATASAVLITSIKVNVTTNLVVIEGRPPKHIHVTSTLPPSGLCLPQDNGQCLVQIITVVKTEHREIRCSRSEIIPQFVLGVTSIGNGNSNKCGVPLTKDNYQVGVSIPVKATIDRVIDRDQIRKVTVMVRVTGEITKQTTVINLGEVQVKAVDRDKRATCASVNDPHIRTMDGLRYDNFIPGEFVLYKHDTLPYEVRGLYRRCSPRHTQTCNCGAAVKSGDDVITFNSCDARQNQPRGGRPPRVTAINVQMFRNGQLTENTRVMRLGCGQKYEVHLPTGTKVTIAASRPPFINIYVTASSTDFRQSNGLCGNHNGVRTDDLGSLTVTSFNRQWIRRVTIFQGVPPERIPNPPQYCSCQDSQAVRCNVGLDVYRCTYTRVTGLDVTQMLVRQSRAPQSQQQQSRQQQQRGKRAAPNDLSVVSTAAPSSAISLENATAYCTDYLENSNLTKKCVKFLDANSSSDSIKDCATDLEAMGDRAWALSHLDHIVSECMDNAERDVCMKPVTNDTKDEDFGVSKDIANGLCVEDCGTHGSCVQGLCLCESGWTGDLCNVNANTVPEVYPAEEACDTTSTSCSEVKIDGNDFVPSENLTCFFNYISANGSGPLAKEKIRGSVVSFSQVICSEPETQLKGSNALVTVSNDGVRESEQSYLRVAFKASCQSCQLDDQGQSADCKWLRDSCVIDDACYAKNERRAGDKCAMCNPDINPAGWTQASDPGCSPLECPRSVPVDSDDDKTTIIIALGALSGVLALVSLIAIIISCRARRMPKDALLAPANSSPKFDIHRKNVTDPTRDMASINPVYYNAE